MLFMNKTLLRLARGLWLWILAIAGVSFLTLVGTTALAEIIAGFLGSLFEPQGGAVIGGQCHPWGTSGGTVHILCTDGEGTAGIQDSSRSENQYAPYDLFQGTGAGCRRH